MTVCNALQGRNPTISQPDARMHPKHIFFVSKMFLGLSPLQTDLVECYTPNFQCQSTRRKRNTLLQLTETQIHFLCYCYVYYTRTHKSWRPPSHVPTLSKPTVQVFHAHIFRSSNSQIPHITTCTDWNLRGNIILQRQKRMGNFQTAGVALRHAHCGNFSNYVAQHR